MQYQQFGDHYVLRLMPDEEVMATLLQFVNDERIFGAYFMAFGAFSRVQLRYFDVATRQYRNNEVDRQVEVVSLLGNVSLSDGKPMIHMHATVGDALGHSDSGHIGEGIVRPTLEVFLTQIGGELHRTKDEASGLELLNLPETAAARRER